MDNLHFHFLGQYDVFSFALSKHIEPAGQLEVLYLLFYIACSCEGSQAHFA